MRGCEMLGAMSFFERAGCLSNVNVVVGTSVGSLIGAAFCAKGGRMSDIFHDTVKHFGYEYDLDFRHLDSTFGIDSGSCIDSLIESVLGPEFSSKTLEEFDASTGKTFVAVAANVSGRKVAYLSSKTNPNVPLVAAIRASCSIPLLMSAVKIDGSLYVDGGLVDNFPIKTAIGESVDGHVLGIVLSESLNAQETPRLPSDFQDFLQALVETGMGSTHPLETFVDDKSVDVFTLYNDNGTKAMNFNVSTSERESMFQSGRRAAATWLVERN